MKQEGRKGGCSLIMLVPPSLFVQPVYLPVISCPGTPPRSLISYLPATPLLTMYVTPLIVVVVVSGHYVLLLVAVVVGVLVADGGAKEKALYPPPLPLSLLIFMSSFIKSISAAAVLPSLSSCKPPSPPLSVPCIRL